MKTLRVEPGHAVVELTTDDLWTLRHCAIEALEALSGSPVAFTARVGAPVGDARRLVDELKELAKATETPPPEDR